MKSARYIAILMLLHLVIAGVWAQSTNTLTIPDVKARYGKVWLPVIVDNTDEIVAMQFDLTLPKNVTIYDGTSFELMERSQGMVASVTLLRDNVYRVLLYSPDNFHIAGHTGEVMRIALDIPKTLQEGESYYFNVNDAVLSKVSGENVLSGVTAGSLYIKKGPDLLVKDVVVEADDPGPGDKVSVSWKVANVGEMDTGNGWKEYVSLVTLDGNARKTIAERTYNENLVSGAEVSRSLETRLPNIIGADGLSRVKVEIVPLNASDEASDVRGNNTMVSTATIDVQKQLTLDISPKTVKEGGSTPVKVKLTRSGRTDISQTFNISATQDSRVNIPDEITISSGSSFFELNLNIVGNDEADADSVINVTIEGNDYQPVSGSFKIKDNIYPMLGFASSSKDVYEGRSFQLNITRNFANQKPLEVEIASDSPGRFEFPSKVTMQPGEFIKSVEVKVIDNDEIETDESFSFRATTAQYESGECLVMFHDNDLPSLSFIVSPDAIGEAQGVESPAIGVIRSTDKLNTSIEFRFSNDSKGELKLPESVIMASGSKEVQFPISIEKDNTDNEGNRTYNITAMVYSPSCGCTLSGSVGALSTTLTIIDDDGPALQIGSKSTAVLEGSKGNVFVIKSNNTPATDLRLHISSNRDDMLVYNHELTLPKGSSSVQLLVDVKSNSEQGDDGLATFKVQADGYAMGSYTFMITDQNLPDATVRIMPEKTVVESEGVLPVVLCVRNTGNAVLSSGVPIAIELVQDNIIKNKVVTTLSHTVEAGDSILVNYNYALPNLVGQYILSAHINPTQKSVKELIYVNNSSNDVSISIVSPISLTAKADKSFYRNGEVVTVSGQASGDKGKNTEVKVYFVNYVNGKPVRQEMKVKTDDKGQYSYAWHPVSTQIGHYSVGACYPTDNNYEEMDAFDIAGLRVSQSYFKRKLVLSQTDTVRIKVYNPLDIRQTNLNVTAKGQHKGCDASFSCPDNIEAGDSINLEIYLKGTELTQGKTYMSLPLEITTAEGSVLSIGQLYYYVNPPKAYLWTNTKTINTTMTMGQVKEYPIIIHNKGLASTGNITVNMEKSLSHWISPKSVAPIEPGDSATVVFKFTPDESMELNKAKAGYFVLNCQEKGTGVTIYFNITPVTDIKGKLTLDVVDNFTYYGIDEDTQLANTLANTNSLDSAPHVDNAKVTVRNPGTNELVAEGMTAGNGLFMMELPGGFYNFTVEAEGHKKSTFTKEVPSGTDTKHEVMLWCDDYLETSWSVEETEIEDEYKGSTSYTFETRVPVPRLIVTFPKERPLPGTVFPVSFANKGYVNAYEANLSLSVSNGYELEFLNETYWDVLGPNQSQIVYVKLMENDNKPAQAKRIDIGSIDPEDCSTLALMAGANANVKCDKYSDGIRVSYQMEWGKIKCVSDPPPSSPGSYPPPSGPPTMEEEDDNPDKPKDKEPKGPKGPTETTVLDCFSCNFDCPTLNYLVVRVGGNPLLMDDRRNGVAADGVSKVKILLGPGSKYPPNICSDGESHYWYLSEPLGKLSGCLNDWQIVYYTAPESLPEGEKSHTVYAIHEWTWKGCSGKERIPIEIRRPPLLLLHGLNDANSEGMNKIKDYVVSQGLYDSEQVCNQGYGSRSNAHFKQNQNVAAPQIEQLINTYREKYGLVATKVDIVGYSMGGVLARLHVQYNNNKNVNKVITVNTPHSGSEVGDIVMWHPALWKLVKMFGYNPLDAVSDLATESAATDVYLNDTTALKKMEDIAVHAIVTKYPLGDMLAAGAMATDFLAMCSMPGSFGSLVALTITVAAKAAPNVVVGDMEMKDLEWMKFSDLVVTTESQMGGLGWENITYITGPNHLESPKDAKVHSAIATALTAAPSSSMFSKSGFHPSNLCYTKMSAPRKDEGKKKIRHADMQLQAWRDGNTLYAKANKMEDMSQMIVAVFDNQNSHVTLGDTLMCEIPSTFSGDVSVYVMCLDAKDEALTDSTTVNIPQPQTTPKSISYGGSAVFTIGYDRGIILKCLWDDGSETYVEPNRVESAQGKVVWTDGEIKANEAGEDVLTFYYNDLSCTAPIEVYKYVKIVEDYENEDGQNSGNGTGGVDDEDEDEDDENSASVCSSIKLVISQKMVMTRQAFRGTLSLKNKLEDIPMKNVKFILDVRDANGKVATSREMQVDVESLVGLTGEKNLTSGWTLAPKTEGKVTILFIPSRYAAPTEPMIYSFGGTLTYTDPYTDRTISRQFTPVKLEVRPSPVLELAYFMQRDVLGDDPLTEEVEPMEPAEFALLVNNKGYGDAKNVKITTDQPEIIENEKGIAIDFEIVSSQLNGGEKHLALGESVESDFGTIEAHSQAYAQWWLQSSLLGHFTEYDVDVTHVTSYNNPDLSLIEENPVIHELIHGFDCYGNDGKKLRGFLVNDIHDKKDQPDHVYFTDATDEGVFTAFDMQCERSSELVYKLNVTPSVSGWNYGVMTDPTNGKGELQSIVRERDGKVLATDNVWRTDRTLRDGKDPVYENKLHFVGNFTDGQESYILTFSPAPDLTLDVENVYGVPDENTLLQTPLKQVQVVFNKPIVATSFGVDDITLVCQGQPVETTGVTITRMDDSQYQLDLSAATLADGYYVLTILTNQITDQEGFNGKKGKQVSWVQYAGGMASIVIKAEPENGGTVSPTSGRYEYGKTIRLEAVPSEGYVFSYWSKDGVSLSEEAAYDYYISDHAELHAVFLPQVYKVDISYNPQQGFIIGTPARSYYYDYGTMLHLVAQPLDGYVLQRWMVNGLQAGVKDSCDVVVTGPMSIAPLFVDITVGLDGLVKRPGTIKYWPIPVDDLLYISGDFQQIREVKVYDVQGKVCLVCSDVGENGAVSLLSLPPGMYILSVATDNGVYRGKVTKR